MRASVVLAIALTALDTTTVPAQPTVTTTTRPSDLQCEEIVARDFVQLAANLAECHKSAARHTLARHNIELHCAKLGRPGRQARCLKKAGRRRCKNSRRNQTCLAWAVNVAGIRISSRCPEHLQAQSSFQPLRYALAATLGGYDGDAYCRLKTAVEGLVSLPDNCRAAGRVPVNGPRFDRDETPVLKYCGDQLVDGLAGYVKGLAECRIAAATASSNAAAYDEAGCIEQVPCPDYQQPAYCGVCVDTSQACADLRGLVLGFLGMVYRPCVGPDGNTLDCDDANSCTIDRCDGIACTHENRPEGESCPVDDPCTAGTCQRGRCVDTRKPQGSSCAAGNMCRVCEYPLVDGRIDLEHFGCLARDCDDGDPCTADDCDPDRGCVHVRIAGCQAGNTPGIDP